MSIFYEEQSRTIILHTVSTTYQMQIDRYGFLFASLLRETGGRMHGLSSDLL